MLKSVHHVAAAESYEVLANEIGNATGEEITSQDSLFVAFFDGVFDVAGIIGNARDTEKSALLIEDVVHLVDRLMFAIAKVIHGQYVDKADPFAFYSEMRPQSCSRLFDVDHFMWHDEAWLKTRTRNFDKPMSIYECHLGSWKGKIGDRYPSYEEAADFLIPYLKELGYTHVSLRETEGESIRFQDAASYLYLRRQSRPELRIRETHHRAHSGGGLGHQQ